MLPLVKVAINAAALRGATVKIHAGAGTLVRRILLLFFVVLAVFLGQLALADQAQANAKDQIMRWSRHYAGTTYQPVSWNCSDYTRAVMGHALNIWIPDDVSQQRFYGRHPDHRKRGDLIFFTEHGGSVPSHVGIYAGNGLLWHNSSYPAYNGVVKSPIKYIKGYRPGYTVRLR